MSKKALVVIDYTNDFVADDGKLTCGKPAQDIENEIANLINGFGNSNCLVIQAVDIHKENDIYHPETKLFPAHNIEGTSGRDLYGKVKEAYENNKQNTIWLDKTRYSAFAGTNLEIILRERNIDEIHLVGVCTDICVLHTAVDAYNKGFKIVVHERGVASFNQEGHTWALGHFKNTLGAEVI